MFDERPTTGSVTTWYVERRVAGSEHDVTGALGEALRGDGVEPETRAPVDAVRHGRPGAARGFTSRLRLGRLTRPIAIEVEVEPWSLGRVRARGAPRTPPGCTGRASATSRPRPRCSPSVERCIADRLDVRTPAEVRRAS